MDFDFFSPSACPDVSVEEGGADSPKPGPRYERLWRAYATLSAGCTFVATEARQDDMTREAASGRLRMMGNRLHELDRFLSVLIDEAAALGKEPRLGDRFFTTMHNTPEKLRRLGDGGAGMEDLRLRLRAIGKICAYLRHCGDDIHREDLAGHLLAAEGRAGEGVPTEDPQNDLPEAPAFMASVGLFYRSVGDALVATVPIGAG